jgi:hypothetical protein
MSQRLPIANVFRIARETKRMNSNYLLIKQALQQLVEATATAQTLTAAQKTALDKAIIALQSNS